MQESQQSGMKQAGYEFFRALGAPSRVVAPMVNQSELAFRVLTRRYGAQLCYTPMFNSRNFVADAGYRKDVFKTCAGDRPLVVQFCGHDPETLVQAAQLVADRCDAVDINLGCPQGIAKRGHYGAFLLEHTQLLRDMVTALHTRLPIPVTCKIRLLPTDEETDELVDALVESGCQLLTVHGRTREEKKHQVRQCWWRRMARLRDRVPVPLVANGGLATEADVAACLSATAADGVMTSEAVLENPAFFSGNVCSARRCVVTQDSLCAEYLELARTHGATSTEVSGHIFKFLYGGITRHMDVRDKMATARWHLDPERAFVAALLFEIARRKQAETVAFWTAVGEHDAAAAAMEALRAAAAAVGAGESEPDAVPPGYSCPIGGSDSATEEEEEEEGEGDGDADEAVAACAPHLPSDFLPAAAWATVARAARRWREEGAARASTLVTADVAPLPQEWPPQQGPAVPPSPQQDAVEVSVPLPTVSWEDQPAARAAGEPAPAYSAGSVTFTHSLFWLRAAYLESDPSEQTMTAEGEPTSRTGPAWYGRHRHGHRLSPPFVVSPLAHKKLLQKQEMEERGNEDQDAALSGIAALFR